jgi:hypothetical protein
MLRSFYDEGPFIRCFVYALFSPMMLVTVASMMTTNFEYGWGEVMFMAMNAGSLMRMLMPANEK